MWARRGEWEGNQSGGKAGGLLPPEAAWAPCVHVYIMCVRTVSIIQDSLLLLDQAGWSHMSTFTQRQVEIYAQGLFRKQLRCHTGVEGQRTFEVHELILDVESRWRLSAQRCWYLVLHDDPVGLCWFSPLEDDLLLISAALKWLQRNCARHCGKPETDLSKQKCLPVSWMLILIKWLNCRDFQRLVVDRWLWAHAKHVL